MPYCDECGASVDVGGVTCPACGTRQSAPVLPRGPRLVATLQERPALVQGLWVVAAIAVLGFAYWVGSWPLVFLTTPGLAAGLCVITRPAWTLIALERFERWAPSVERLTRVDHARFSGYVVRPWLWGLSRVAEQTNGIQDVYQRSAIRIAVYLYFCASIALAAYFALTILVGLVLMLGGLIVLMWVLHRLPGRGTEVEMTSDINLAAEASSHGPAQRRTEPAWKDAASPTEPASWARQPVRGRSERVTPRAQGDADTERTQAWAWTREETEATSFSERAEVRRLLGAEDPAELFSNMLNLCFQQPEVGLAFLDDFVSKNGEFENEPFIRFCRASAFAAKSLARLLEARVDYTVAEGNELHDYLDHEDLELLEQALSEIRKIEDTDPEFLDKIGTEQERLGQVRLDGIATVLERCRPGRVQEILGKTKLFYFGRDRLFVSKYWTDHNFRPYLNHFFASPSLVRSAMVASAGAHQGKNWIFVVLYEEPAPFRDDGEQHAIRDMLYLFEDGTCRRGSLDD